MVTAGSIPAIDAALRPDGRAPISSSLITCWRVVLCTSTIGVSPLTVIVSSSAPTRISTFTVATNVPVSSMPSRLAVANPGSVNVTVYVPGRRVSIRYWPVPSVTTDRTFSISTGLAASTVTPGSTAPEPSLTTPVMDAWAYAAEGRRANDANRTSESRTHRRMGCLLRRGRRRRYSRRYSIRLGASQRSVPCDRMCGVQSDLAEAIDFHNAIIAEGNKALIGYATAKALANVVLLSEIPTTYDKSEQRQVNAGNLLLRGVPGVGKTFFGVILAAISDAKFARLQGRADLQ